MRTRTITTFAFTLATALAATGCSGNPQPGEGAGDAFVIVDNSTTTIADATIHLVEEDIGTRRMLGSVGLQERKQFTVRTPRTGQYQLVADVLGRPDVVSNPFTLVEGDVIEWDLDSNLISLEADR